jgi:methionyl-tRNA formyltransferase
VLGRQIDRLLAGTATGTPQDEAAATYYGGRTPEDGRIDWSAPAVAVHNLVRAVTDPYPGAFTDFAGARLMVWQTRPLPGEWGAPGQVFSLDPLTIATGDGAVQLLRFEWRGQAARGLTVGDIL